jgi:hypothetical protein
MAKTSKPVMIDISSEAERNATPPPYTAYIAGPMTGLPNYNYEQFDEVEAQLSRMSRMTRGRDGVETVPWTVVNPASNFNGVQTLPRREYIALAMRQVASADALVLLPNWQLSDGAKLEAQTALDLGLDFYVAYQYDDDAEWQIGMTSHEVISEILAWSDEQTEDELAKQDPAYGMTWDDTNQRWLSPPLDGMQLEPEPERVTLPREFSVEMSGELFEPDLDKLQDFWKWNPLTTEILFGRQAEPLTEINPEYQDTTVSAERIEVEYGNLVRYGARRETYGHPSGDFTRIALIWSGILGITVTKEQVAICMSGLKLARLAETPKHRDSNGDAIGYLVCLDELNAEEAS